MTENEFDELKDAICELVCIAEGAICHEGFVRLDNAGAETIGCLEELEKYQSIGTVEECREAVERMKPKKPIILDRKFQNGEEVCTEWKCPVCGLNVIEEPPCQEYCQRCGNKLDWSE